MTKFERLARLLWYFRIGYSSYLSLPVAIFGHISAIYFLFVKGTIPWLFPQFETFAAFFLVVLPLLGIVLGYWHFKRSPLFRAEQYVTTEANPYATHLLVPVSVPFWEVLVALAKQHGIDTSQLETIIEESKKKNGMIK